MAITFVAAGTSGDNGAVGSGNPTAPGIPAGMAAGDLGVLIVHSCDNVNITTPVGWTLKQAQNAGTALRQTIFWRRWQSGDAAPTIAHTAGDACQARIYGYRGVSTTAADPIEAIATTAATGTATVSAASITTVSDNAAVVGAWAEEVTGNTSGSPTWASYSGTNPTFAEVGENNVDNLNANELGVGVAWGTCTPAGTVTGARTAVVSGAAALPTNVIGTLLALTADVPAGGSRPGMIMPLTGTGLPGYPPLAPPIGPTYPPDASTFDVVTPLPTTRFVNPLSLVMGPGLFPFPQPTWTPTAATDVNIIATVGILNLTAGTHSFTEDFTEPVGILNLGAGTHTFTENYTHTVGILNLTAGTQVLTEQWAPTVGILNLTAGANQFGESFSTTVGILNLTAGTHAFTEDAAPTTAGVLSLTAGTHVVTGASSTSYLFVFNPLLSMLKMMGRDV